MSNIYASLIGAGYGDGNPPSGNSWEVYLESIEDLALQVEAGCRLAEQYSRVLADGDKRDLGLSESDTKFFKNVLSKVSKLHDDVKKKREEFTAMKNNFKKERV